MVSRLKTEVVDHVLDDDEYEDTSSPRQSIDGWRLSASAGGCPHRQARQPPIAANGGQLTCLVCGDTATGRHYGSVACNGCKGFFRRTIRRAYKYSCRFNGNCQIDKHNRAVCRACRYARCIQFGMKIDAVQNERDLIGKRSRYTSACSPKSLSPNHGNSMDALDSGVAALYDRSSTSEYHNGGHDAFLTSTSSAGCSMAQQPPPQPSLSSAAHPSVTVKSRRVSGSGAKNYEFRKHYTNGSQQQQHERSDGGPTSGDPWDAPQTLLDLLIGAEEKVRRIRDSVIKESGKFEYTTHTEPSMMTTNGRRRATIKDIFHSLHSQLLLVIEWAKSLRPFAELSTADQTALLKSFASQHIVLSVAYRSINASDSLKLLNDSCIPRANATDYSDGSDYFYKKDCERVMDTLVAPMRFLKMNDVEFSALKACILFNPVARGLSKESVLKVLETRRKIFGALQYYIGQRSPHEPHRIGDLLFFVLSPLQFLQCLARSVSEDVLVTKLSGVARIDQLMEELILEDTDTKQFGANTSPDHDDRSGSASSGVVYARQDNDDNLVYGDPGRGGAVSSASSGYYVADGHRPPSMAQQLATGEFCDRTESASSGGYTTLQRATRSGNALDTSFGGISAPSNPSPIYEFEMFSTLSSYVLGGPLQGAIFSPSNDVLLSSTCAASESPNSPPPPASVLNCHPFQSVPSTTLDGGAAVIIATADDHHAGMVQQPTSGGGGYLERVVGGDEMSVVELQPPQSQQAQHYAQLVHVTLPLAPQAADLQQQQQPTMQLKLEPSPTQRLLAQPSQILQHHGQQQQPAGVLAITTAAELDPPQYYASPQAEPSYMATTTAAIQSHSTDSLNHQHLSADEIHLASGQQPQLVHFAETSGQPPIQLLAVQQSPPPVVVTSAVGQRLLADRVTGVTMADELVHPQAGTIAQGAREPAVWTM